VTAWGQKIDLILFNPSNWDVNWNAVWKAKTGLEDSAWVTEIEIPFSQLRYSKANEQVWGMHTWRMTSRLSEEDNWERQSKTGPGIMYNFGELRGITGLKKSRRLEILPFMLGDIKTMKKEPGNPFAEKGRILGGNAGLDAKIGVSSNFTVDLTVNPDFGQVESDPSVMNLTAFETFYEEKRPFFLEGLTIFDYKFDDQSLFYSRRIGHAPSLAIDTGDSLFVRSPDKTTILSALKFSGTTSRGLSVGLIQSVTANQQAHLSDLSGKRSKVIVEPLTSYTVGRVQKGYNSGNTVIGGMITSTNRVINDNSLEFLGRNAYTGGLDLLHHWRDKEFFIDARLIGSYINGTARAINRLQESPAHYFQRPAAAYLDYDTTRTSLSGWGGKVRIGKGSKGLWKYSAGVTLLSPGLDLNDLGYMQEADYINETNEISYLINKPVSVFHSYTINLEQFNSWNFDGTFLGSGGHLSFSSEFINNWKLNANLIFHSGRTDTRILRGGPDMRMPAGIMSFGGIESDGSKKITGRIEYQYETAVNKSAMTYTIQPGFSIRPFSALRIGVTADISKNKNDLQYVTALDYLETRRYILGKIDQNTLGLTFRVDVNFTPEFSIQYYGSPFISNGKYSGFKHITNPMAKNYSERFLPYYPMGSDENRLYFDENNDFTIDYGISNPDFNFYQFRSNLVAKWEYRPGSFVYIVWSGERTGYSSAEKNTGESFRLLSRTFPNNIFLIKLNYWFSL
jgi:hypothetical protein